MTDILRLGGDRIAALCFAGMICVGLPAVASAAVINRGVEGPPLSEIRPAPNRSTRTSRLSPRNRRLRKSIRPFSGPSC